MQPGWSHPQHSSKAEAPEPAPSPTLGQLPAKPLLSEPTMERRAEINRFAIFLFCMLVPLGSLAPTEISESELTMAERRKSFISEIPYMSAALKDQARDLSEFYQKCVCETFRTGSEKIGLEFKDLMEETLACPAFQENCCVLHDIYNMLKSLGSYMGTICRESPTNVTTANLRDLNLAMSQGTAFYTCKAKEQLRGWPEGLADRKYYIWWFLKRYRDITQTAAQPYSG